MPLVALRQTWKKLILVHKPIFGVEKCPQIQVVSNNKDMRKID